MKDRSNRKFESPVLGAVRHPRNILPDSIYKQLREALMSGAFPPGRQLTLREVADQMGTSLMPVREAFRRLTSEGALEPLANGTTRVPVLDLERLEELAELRMVIEGFAARRAASFISPAELDALEHANGRMLRAIRDRDALAETRANEEFHFCIYRAARSDDLLRMIEPLWLRIGPFLTALLVSYEQPGGTRKRKSSRHHSDLLKALRNGDGKRAEAALRADLAEGTLFFREFARTNRSIPRAASG